MIFAASRLEVHSTHRLIAIVIWVEKQFGKYLRMFSDTETLAIIRKML